MVKNNLINCQYTQKVSRKHLRRMGRSWKIKRETQKSVLCWCDIKQFIMENDERLTWNYKKRRVNNYASCTCTCEAQELNYIRLKRSCLYVRIIAVSVTLVVCGLLKPSCCSVSGTWSSSAVAPHKTKRTVGGTVFSLQAEFKHVPRDTAISIYFDFYDKLCQRSVQ